MKNDSYFWLFLLGGILLLGGGGYAVYTMTRGLRNNNPGNLRISADHWDGLRPTQTDPAYFQFTDSIYGIRALTKTLSNYQQLYGLNTIADIITRWAPPGENDTASYIRNVQTSVGIPVDMPFNVWDYMPQLVSGIIQHENGVNPYSADTIAQGIALAS